jgi:arginine N-succinyltransferase
MILLREIQEKDIDALEKLAQIPGFINLAGDKEALKEKIGRSRASFKDVPTTGKYDGKYIFVAEDLETHQVLGTSMIAGQHGTVESPHFYFEVSSEQKFSDTINTGFIHGTLKLKYDTNGPSEIGGLVLNPDYRNSEARVGRQISFVRFLYLGLNRNRFKRKVLAELLPPLNTKGQSPLWEAVGRRFTNMDYWEADQLCQKNKEFIFSLFPSGKIYTTFLTAEARNSIGKVGKETEPVLHMLKKIGFEYKNQVDPFDGGPHLWAGVEDILPLKKLVTYTYDPTLEASRTSADEHREPGLIAKTQQTAGQFKAIAVQRTAVREGRFCLLDPSSAQAAAALSLAPGDTVAFMPYY